MAYIVFGPSLREGPTTFSLAVNESAQEVSEAISSARGGWARLTATHPANEDSPWVFVNPANVLWVHADY